MVRQAERDVVVAQQIENFVLVPARIAKLEGVAPLLRQQLEERGEPLAVGLKLAGS